jgi:hypothetical protein
LADGLAADRSGIAAGVGRVTADVPGRPSEWRLLVDWDIKGRLRELPLGRRLALFFRILGAHGVALPEKTPIQETGSGGVQTFLTGYVNSGYELWQRGVWLSSRETVLVDGKTVPLWVVELKGDGYGAVPPTLHPKTGRAYDWIIEPTGPPPTAPAALTREVVRKLTPPRPPRPDAPCVDRDADGILEMLEARGLYIREDGDRHLIVCPWDHEHEKRGHETKTVLFDDGERIVGFKCLGAHCAHRSLTDVLDFVVAARGAAACIPTSAS